ncbi:MAG TPA: GNAT family N-acetyltransferase [Duganella sp.]|jgi:GNAT superfamily N-acetyltransferase|uniref:GNAT family N-acetyltransferase n=1 Tax=Duganella sp. TaxID=1904440 RepID=UPI002ED47BAA
MIEELQFVPLKAPLSNKALLAYRKDAAWSSPLPTTTAQDARGKVQWVSVEWKTKQIGIARLELAPPEFCYLSELIVSSKFRGRGVGRWFMARIEQYCHAQGIRRLLLESGDGTESFYKAQGFVADPLLPNLLKKNINPLQRKMFLPLGR